MQINHINTIVNLWFGMLSSELQYKMNEVIHKNPLKPVIKNYTNERAYRDFCYILKNSEGSYLFEKRIGDKKGFICDDMDKLPNIDISEAYKEKYETPRYLKMIKIVAKSIRNCKSKK